MKKRILQSSKIIEYMLSRPSPIREIMRMADPKNLASMGLDPKNFISFAGGWVNHQAPEALRQKYIEFCTDKEKFHKLGGYSPTPGEEECRKMLAEFEKKIFGMKNITYKNIIVGQSSTQMTHDMLKTLLNPGDDVVLFDPTYANYYGQLYFTVPDTKIETTPTGINLVVPTIETAIIPVLDTKKWKYLPDQSETLKNLKNALETHTPKLLLFPSPDNPTSQILPDKFVKEVLEFCLEYGIYVAIDFAYKTQYFGELPKYYSYSPEDYPNLIGLNSNSKWNRGLGRRLGWVEASKRVVDALERTQQCTILCPDTIHQHVLSAFLKESLADGSLKKYIDDARAQYEKAAKITVKAIDDHLGMKRLVPQGGLYTVVDVGVPADDFVQDVMKNTAVLFVPGTGFGSTLKNAVRISYGPLVQDTEKIKEGFERVGKFLKKKK